MAGVSQFHLYLSANAEAWSSKGAVVVDIDVDDSLEPNVGAFASFILRMKSSSNMGPSVRQWFLRGYSLYSGTPTQPLSCHQELGCKFRSVKIWLIWCIWLELLVLLLVNQISKVNMIPVVHVPLSHFTTVYKCAVISLSIRNKWALICSKGYCNPTN